MSARAPAALLLGSDACSSSQTVDLTAGTTALAHDCWTGWGADAVPRHVHVYTDGSHDEHGKPKPTSSWAVTIGDRWLDDNFARLPADEQHLNVAQVGGSSLFGASIAVTSGVYPAELQAIARVLAMFPLPHSLHIHSDSQAAMAGIRAYSAEVNSRQRLRMAARPGPLLQLIHHQLTQRRAAGGTVEFEHVRAHSTAADIHSVGNRLADYKANTTRARPQTKTPVTIGELPLAECEHRLTVWTQAGGGLQVSDDTRRTALAQLKAQSLSRWAERPPSDITDGSFACPALLDTSKEVMACGSSLQQATFLHVATNSIQCCWQKLADGTSKVLPLPCNACGVALTLTHLAVCKAPDGVSFRDAHKRGVLDQLDCDPATTRWRQVHQHLPLTDLLARLFPPPPGVPNDLHITRVMCGVFSTRQANAALKLLGVTNAKDGRQLMRQLRLCCLDGLHQHFNALKIALL